MIRDGFVTEIEQNRAIEYRDAQLQCVICACREMRRSLRSCLSGMLGKRHADGRDFPHDIVERITGMNHECDTGLPRTRSRADTRISDNHANETEQR
jgi:hypothetical protein